MMLVAYNHGLRASEVINLQADDIADDYLTVQRLKGSLRTVQPLLWNADSLFSELEPLNRFADQAGTGERLFPLTRQRFWQLVREYGEAAGIPRHKCSPHKFKHTTAMQTIDSAGIQNTRQWLGHVSGASTMEYLKVSDADAGIAMTKALK